MYYIFRACEYREAYFAIKADSEDEAYEIADCVYVDDDLDWSVKSGDYELSTERENENEVYKYTPIFEADEEEGYTLVRE